MEIIDKDLLEILACPRCHSSLELSGEKLICLSESCRSDFSVKNKVPVLLPSPKLAEFKQAQVEFFDHWSSREQGGKPKRETSFDRFFSPVVGEKGIDFSEREMKRLIAGLSESALVLEIGCGAGEHTSFLARLRDDLHIIAIDLSLKSAVETRERIRNDAGAKSKVNVVVADAECLPFKDGVFKGILTVMLFHHMNSSSETLGEMRRTLCLGGVGLVVDFISDNPLVVLPRRAFPYLPSRIKERWGEDYLLEDGEMPLVSIHSSKEFKKDIADAQLKIIEERRHDLFVFILGMVGGSFPLLKYLFPESVLRFLYGIDKRLVRVEPFRRFTGAIALWLSRVDANLCR